MLVFKDSLTKVVANNDTDIWTPSWGIRMAHILKESANRDGGQGQSWCGRWQFRTKTAWWELFLTMILTSELHQVLTHLFHTRAAVDFEPVPACPLPVLCWDSGIAPGSEEKAITSNGNQGSPDFNPSRGQVRPGSQRGGDVLPTIPLFPPSDILMF